MKTRFAEIAVNQQAIVAFGQFVIIGKVIQLIRVGIKVGFSN